MFSQKELIYSENMALPFLKDSKGKGIVPVERVRDLTSRGFSEVEVIDILRKEGYSPEEIDKALTQTAKFEAAKSPETIPSQQKQTEPTLPTLEELTSSQPQTPQLPETSIPQEYYQQQYPTEEYVDYVVQARMGELNQKLTEFSIKAQEIEKRLDEVNDRINEILNLRNAEQTQILSKIDTFKESVGEIDTRISSLEKAFKQTLPALIESVRALSELVQRLKQKEV